MRHFSWCWRKLILDALNRLRGPLIASTQGIATSADDPAGRLQRGVLMAAAEFERGIIKERVTAGLAAAGSVASSLAARPPSMIRKLKAKGLGLRAIARQVGGRRPPRARRSHWRPERADHPAQCGTT